MSKNIFKNFSTNYKQVLVRSIRLAGRFNKKNISPEFILFALIKQKSCLGAQILKETKINTEKIKYYCLPNNQQKTIKENLNFSPNSLKIIEKSAIIAFSHKHSYIATEHLMQALIESQDQELNKIFQDIKLNQSIIKNKLQIIFNNTSRFKNFNSSENNPPNDDLIDLPTQSSKTNLLETFTIDLTQKNIQGKIDPIIGRDEEIDRVIEILMRRTKNNPLILGDPGVGKTALVEGLAKKIVNQEAPEILLDKKILSLDIAAIIAGTMFRGEFENRIKIILEEIKKDPNIIVFIDEIHNIIGAGSTQGSLDIANILKPALARGEIRCIGATTFEEYKKNIANDAALERRFQVIKLNEPNIEETKEILNGVKHNYEKYHQVEITDQAIKVAVELSHKYINDRCFPDKAIDLIDEAASRLKINQKINPGKIKLKQIEEKVKFINKKKEKAIIDENFKQAIIFKKEEIEINDQIHTILEKLKSNTKLKKPQVTEKNICQVISKITKIPINELLLEENNKFLKLEKHLRKAVIGQDKALTILAQTIRRSKAGISEQDKPLGSFIFIGPSGTGKTHTAKILNQLLFENMSDSLIKIDMSEFSEKFNISKLIGAPAGYVGYKESGQLTDAVKNNPNSIILLDEIEKAHPDVLNLLLQIFDDGSITDASGKKISFKNTIIILTSNIGSEKTNEGIGFKNDATNQDDLSLKQKVNKFFRPEFVNRLDKIIVFNNLTKSNLIDITKIELDKLKNRLSKKNITLKTDQKTIEHILETNFEEEKGARFIIQNIEELITNPLAEQILNNPEKKEYKTFIKKNILEIKYA